MSEINHFSKRQNQVLELITRRGSVSMSELIDQFSISEATARRDLNTLAREGKIQRFHGGAIHIQKAAPEEPVLRRTHDQADEKERIGKAAAALIKDGETIFLGSGTTVLQVAKNLIDRQLTVITNSLPILNLMAECSKINLVSLGGQFRHSERSFIGHITELSLQDLRADKVIIGIRAISVEHGLTNDYLMETMTDRAILKVGQKVIIVADHTKFGRISTVHVAPIDETHTIITDQMVEKKYKDLLKSRNIELILV
jgi:DeoR/GlpR family transcriptional regulator of sugar metabolism